MKKGTKAYIIFWIILVVLFYMITFMTPNEMNGLNKFEGAFWPGFISIMLTFVAHLIFVLSISKTADKDERILNVSIVTLSIIELFAMIAAGSICMAVPDMPSWLGLIICLAVLAFSIITVLNVKVVGETTSNANMELNARTEVMRDIIGKMQALTTKGKTEKAKAEIHRVYEAIKYSDLGSYPETRDYEEKLEELIGKMKELLESDENDNSIKNVADEIVFVAEQRNNKCRSLKKTV